MDENEHGDTESISKSRRNFFRVLFAETIAIIEETKGRPQMRLSDLSEVPDEIVSKMIPVFNSQAPFAIEGERIIERDRRTGERSVIRQLEPREGRILLLFDGAHTIEEICTILTEQNGLSSAESFTQVKTLFISLARLAIYVPSHPHERAT